MLGRRWWGADSDPNAHEVTQERLLAVCGLQVHKDYVLYEMADLWDVQAMETDYQGVVTNIEQIIQLQRDIDELTNHLISFKMLLDIRDDDEGLTEDTIEQMEQEITALLNQRRSVESYIPVVCAWLVDWDQLDGASRVFLPQAEMAFEMLSRNRSQDYSMFILQYCRALENELLTKLFVAYTGDLYARFTNVSAFLSKETGETKSFAASLKNRKEGYTLGEMVRILDLLQTDDQLVVRSDLLEDFRSFTLRYFDEHVIDKAYLDRIKEINRDYRRKSAHPYLLDAQAAERCRELLRECLNQLILSYKGSAAAPVPNED